ncbi:MAG: hypothetical protein A2Y95_11495 [Deltaproteobacteria bacterium RBG_13_65_10]|nr:MAG: hypothetical protein A2Y95_11495 [Deltaproteobacteria bacterium RBG_13_65_10]
MTLPLLIAVAAAYLVASLFYVNLLLSQRTRAEVLARRTLVAGFVLHTAAFVTIHAGGTRVGTPVQDSVSFMAYAIVALWLIFQHRWRAKVLGAFLSPFAFLLVFYATLPLKARASPETLRSLWSHLHIFLSVFGFGFLALAFAAGATYLVQDRGLKRRGTEVIERVVFRLPSLETLDRVNAFCLLNGFPLLTLGMITGGLWESSANASWRWEAHITLSIATWLLYLMIILTRLVWNQRGRRAALLSVLGFIVLTSSYVGVRALG